MKQSLVLTFLCFIILANAGMAQSNVYAADQKMIRLCNWSYMSDIADNGKCTTALDDSLKIIGMKLVWGPEELKDFFGVSYSLMYAVADPVTNDYVVVIRGTNPLSLKTWLSEDFKIHCTKKFKKLFPEGNAGIPGNARISTGTYNGIRDLLKLSDENNSGSIVSFLESKKASVNHLYVTGHSLGGTLAPPFYAYLCYRLFGPAKNMKTASQPFSFAGLTPGNNAFNNFFKGYLPADTSVKWRYVNPLDVAPKLWYDLDGVKNIYAADSITLTKLENDFFDYLFHRAAKNHYVQPAGGELILNAGFFKMCPETFMGQASSQHHSYTYIALVDAYREKRR